MPSGNKQLPEPMLAYIYRNMASLGVKPCLSCVVELSHSELIQHLTQYDLKRLQLYSQNMVDYHLIIDLLPVLARLHFLDRMTIGLSAVQEVGWEDWI